MTIVRSPDICKLHTIHTYHCTLDHMIHLSPLHAYPTPPLSITPPPPFISLKQENFQKIIEKNDRSKQELVFDDDEDDDDDIDALPPPFKPPPEEELRVEELVTLRVDTEVEAIVSLSNIAVSFEHRSESEQIYPRKLITIKQKWILDCLIFSQNQKSLTSDLAFILCSKVS